MTDVEINTSSGNTKRKDPLSELLSPKGGFFASVGLNLSVNTAAHGQAVLRTTSQALRASSPSRGASGEEAKLSGMPRPPLGRGGGIAKQ